MRARTTPIAGGIVLSGAAIWAQQSTLARYSDVGMYLPLPEWLWIQLTVGWAFLIAGTIARARRPASGIGTLMVLFALAWIARLVLVAPSVQFEAIGWGIAFYGLLFVILFAFPSGHLQGWERWAAGTWLAVVTALSVASVALTDFYSDVDVEGCCPNHLLFVAHRPDLVDPLLAYGGVAAALVFSAILARQFVRWRRATFVGRKRLSGLALVMGPLMAMLVVIPLAGVVTSGGLDRYIPDPTGRMNLYVQSAALTVLPLVILVELLRLRLSQARVGDLVASLDEPLAPDALEARLQEVLGDPTARLLFRLPDDGRYVDVDGRDAREDPAAVTPIDARVSLAHDPALDPRLVEATGAAARLSIENARLQAELRAQLLEVRASRRRLVSAGDEARRRVERDLHDGAQQRLVMLAATLRKARGGGGDPKIDDLLAAAALETDHAIDELRDLARGVHPAILGQAGVAAALFGLVDRAPIPVDLDVDESRWSVDIETTAYFLAAEGLANVFKHAGATQAAVTVRQDGNVIHVVVDDDGRGGIDLGGSGIRGLIDRVRAVGGDLTARDTDHGARLEAWIPLETP